MQVMALMSERTLMLLNQGRERGNLLHFTQRRKQREFQQESGNAGKPAGYLQARHIPCQQSNKFKTSTLLKRVEWVKDLHKANL